MINFDYIVILIDNIIILLKRVVIKKIDDVDISRCVDVTNEVIYMIKMIIFNFYIFLNQELKTKNKSISIIKNVYFDEMI